MYLSEAAASQLMHLLTDSRDALWFFGGSHALSTAEVKPHNPKRNEDLHRIPLKTRPCCKYLQLRRGAQADSPPWSFPSSGFCPRKLPLKAPEEAPLRAPLRGLPPGGGERKPPGGARAPDDGESAGVGAGPAIWYYLTL